MAAEPKKFKNFNAFLEHYKGQIEACRCNLGGQNLQKAALGIIEGLENGGIPIPKTERAKGLQQYYDEIRAELGLENKGLEGRVAKSPDHYQLALIARDMFKDILNSEIDDAVIKGALSTNKRFIQKRYDELDGLIKNHESRKDWKKEVVTALVQNADLILQNHNDPANENTIKKYFKVKDGLKIDDLEAFVQATEEQVQRTFALPDRKPLISEGGHYSSQSDGNITPRDTLLNKFFLPEILKDGTVIISYTNPFRQFDVAIEGLESSEKLDALKPKMVALEKQCQEAAKIANTKAHFCNAHAANDSNGKRGLFPWHKGIEQELRGALSAYEKARSGFFASKFKRPESVQKIMKDLKNMQIEISEDCKDIASHYYTSEKLVEIIKKFQKYEKALQEMLESLKIEFKTEVKAKNEEEYQIIENLHTNIAKFNLAIETHLCAQYRDKIEGLPSVKEQQPAALSMRKLGGNKAST